MEISVTGIDHRRAPLELREKLSVAGSALPRILCDLGGALGAGEIAILSTCNRVEVYAVHPGEPPSAETVAALLAARQGRPAEFPAPSFYQHLGADAVRHLFRVTSGLDSMVLGEPQITAQVKEAYRAAREAGTAGRILNRLFQHALGVAKRLRSSTGLGRWQVSVPSVATHLAEKIFQDLPSKRLLVLGAGEMGELTLASLRKHGVTDLRVVSRTEENARLLAGRFGGKAHGIEDLPKVLPGADIVIACLAADRPVLGPAEVAAALEARRQEPLFLIDLGVPRNIHPDVGRLENAYLYDIDDLGSIARQNLREREREAARGEPIIEEETRAFLEEAVPEEVARLLAALRQKLQSLADEELQRTLSRLGDLPEAHRREVAEMSRRLVNKILHTPTERLRLGLLGGDSGNPSEILRNLFEIKE